MDKTKSIKNWGWSIPDILLERTDLDMYEKVLIAIMGRLGALEKPIYPRQKWLAEKMGISESGIRKILKRLRNKKIVKYEGKKWKIAMYSLTDPIGRLSPTQQDGDSPTQQDGDKKDIHSKDIQIKNIATPSVAGKEINDLIEKFRFVNPACDRLFKNKTERDALERLVKKFGIEKIEKIIEALPKINAKPYAPRVTTPYKLEAKFGELLIFIKKEQEKGPKFLQIR